MQSRQTDRIGAALENFLCFHHFADNYVVVMSQDDEVESLRIRVKALMTENERYLEYIGQLATDNKRMHERDRTLESPRASDSKPGKSQSINLPNQAPVNLPNQAISKVPETVVPRTPSSDSQYYANLASADVQGSFETVKRKYQSQRLRSDLMLNESRQGVKRTDQQHFNCLQRCGRYVETVLKVLQLVEPGSLDCELYLEDLFTVLLAAIKYLQDELSAVLVAGHFDHETASLFRTFRRNTSAFGNSIDDLRNAVEIRRCMRPTSRGFQRRGFNPQFNSHFGSGRQFSHHRGRGFRGQHRGGQYSNWINNQYVPSQPGRQEDRTWED